MPVKLESDSEGELDDAPPLPVRDIAEDSRKRKAKDDKLRAMMEDEDEDEAPKKVKSNASKKLKRSRSPSPMPTQSPPSAHLDQEPAAHHEPTPASAPPERTRGKRKVKKKVVEKDEEGYMTTRYEDIWESCSDEEPAPVPVSEPEAARPSADARSMPKSKPMAVGKRGSSKGSAGSAKQGNLMSFFSKK